MPSPSGSRDNSPSRRDTRETRDNTTGQRPQTGVTDFERHVRQLAEQIREHMQRQIQEHTQEYIQMQEQRQEQRQLPPEQRQWEQSNPLTTQEQQQLRGLSLNEGLTLTQIRARRQDLPQNQRQTIGPREILDQVQGTQYSVVVNKGLIEKGRI